MSATDPQAATAPAAEAPVAETPAETPAAAPAAAPATDADAKTEAPAAPANDAAQPAEAPQKTEPTRYTSKRKFDPSKLPITDNPAEIRAQVDFYFSDSNLPTDEHMMTLTGGPENKPVSLAEITRFGRMKRFQPYEAVVAALKDSKIVDVSGEAGKEVIKRKVPFVPNQGARGAEIVRAKEARSIYAKGFGEEEPTTQFDIEAFFSQFGPTNAVRLRRDDETKAFKGSVYVEFENEELAKKFLALDPKPKWKDTDLEILSKHDYVARCMQEIADGIRQPKETRPSARGGRGRGRGGGGRGGGRGGDRDPNDWKKRRDNDQKGGFRDNKRGRGRGVRGGNPNRESRGPRDSNKPREEGAAQASVDPTYANAETRPDASAGQGEESKKRGREDGDAEGAPAKKVDTKAAPAESA